MMGQGDAMCFSFLVRVRKITEEAAHEVTYVSMERWLAWIDRSIGVGLDLAGRVPIPRLNLHGNIWT